MIFICCYSRFLCCLRYKKNTVLNHLQFWKVTTKYMYSSAELKVQLWGGTQKCCLHTDTSINSNVMYLTTLTAELILLPLIYILQVHLSNDAYLFLNRNLNVGLLQYFYLVVLVLLLPKRTWTLWWHGAANLSDCLYYILQPEKGSILMICQWN